MCEGSSMRELMSLSMSKSFIAVLWWGGSHGLASKRILKVTGPPNERHYTQDARLCSGDYSNQTLTIWEQFSRHFCNICASS